jgi:hypothetical protein
LAPTVLGGAVEPVAFGTATFGNLECAMPGYFLISYPETATRLS